MVNDFSDFNLELNYITSDEFNIFKEKIKQNINVFLYDELLNIIKDVFIKTKSYKYDYHISISKAPSYDINLRELKGYKNHSCRNLSNEKENIQITNIQITNRLWTTGNAYFSPSASIFSLKALYYSCLIDSKLYCVDINNLSNFGSTYSLIPYGILGKIEGGIKFKHCEYTYWNKLIKEIYNIDYKPYFELVNKSINNNNNNDYYSNYIPIHELIIFCKILDKEGAICSYKFQKN